MSKAKARSKGKKGPAQELGRKRAQKAGSEEMARIGRLGALARWGPKKSQTSP